MKRRDELIADDMMNHLEAFAGHYILFVNNSPMVITPAYYDAENQERRLLREYPGARIRCEKDGQRIF